MATFFRRAWERKWRSLSPSQTFYKSITRFSQLGLYCGLSLMVQMKMLRPVQILVIVTALSILAGYVVYSQRQHPRSLAPNSKFQLINSKVENSLPRKVPATNQLGNSSSTLLAPDSKVLAPVLKIAPRISLTETNGLPPKSSSRTVFPGSKSAPVFDFQQTELPPKSERKTKNSKSEAESLTRQEQKAETP
jgi:hypothetical protein